MARAPASRRLKVYQAQFGFHDSVVAAPNQAAALAAWGIRQNLFAEGRAKVSDDPAAVEAALAHPEIPLRRAIGSKDLFSLEPNLPQVPDTPSRSKPELKVVPKAKALAPARPPPDRSAVDAAEKQLTAVNTGASRKRPNCSGAAKRSRRRKPRRVGAGRPTAKPPRPSSTRLAGPIDRRAAKPSWPCGFWSPRPWPAPWPWRPASWRSSWPASWRSCRRGWRAGRPSGRRRWCLRVLRP